MAAVTAPPTAPVYPAAILLATFSMLVVLLIIPPMCWHYRNRNLGATLLVAWTILMNFQSFVNALLWPSDDISSWYNGSGLCDVEVKLQVAWAVAAPATLACVLRALANALNTDRATLVKSRAQRRRDYAIDLSWCIGFPMLQMLFHYIVQGRRYYLFGISGCVESATDSWVTIFLIDIPPLLWSLLDAYFAILILARLYLYRLNFASILTSSNTSKSRFMRLYVLCLVFVLAFLPLQVYVLYLNLSEPQGAFSWSDTHSAHDWNKIIMVPSDGAVRFDRWIWLTVGIVVFIFFGLGKEAVSMYRSGMLAMGLGRIFPSLRPDHDNSNSTAGTISSYGSKAKLFFKRKGSISSWRSSSITSRTASVTAPISPKNTRHLETINEDQKLSEKLSEGQQSANLHKTPLLSSQPSIAGRIMSMFRSSEARVQPSSEGLAMTDIAGQPLTVWSAVSVDQASPTQSAPGHPTGLRSL